MGKERTEVPALTICGETLIPDPGGALFWPARKLLVFADLHLEKGSAFAERGVALPPYDSRATLAAMAALCARLQPQTVLCLGDSFHDSEAGARLGPEERAALHALTGQHEWIWIGGNHDPVPPAGLGGQAMTAFDCGPLHFRHEPAPAPVEGEVAGHLHPCARLRLRGRTLRRRCFASDGRRLILPAFGAYTGGLDLHEGAFARLFASGPDAWMLTRNAVYRVTFDRLLPLKSANQGELTI